MYNRLFEIENIIKTHNGKSSDLKEEHKRIFSEVIKLMGNFGDNPDAKVQLDELNVWLENLEQKAFA